MEVWLDSCDRQFIQNACRFGFVDGVTTNPTLLAPIKDHPEDFFNELLAMQEGPITVQVTAEKSEEMVKSAMALHVFSERIIVKIPATQQGLLAMKKLYEEEVPVMATAVFDTSQAILAALSGAAYVAFYFGRMLDAGINATDVLRTTATVFRKQSLETKIMVASLRTADQIVTCAEIGVDAVTLKKSLFDEWVADNKNTLDSLKAFTADWEARDHPRTSSMVL